MRKYLIINYILLVVLIVTSCAIIVGPQGGPKDTTPPQILKQHPENNTKNFKNTKITLTFSEYVKLNDPQKEIIISPFVSPFPEITNKKKSIIINFKNKLDSNTTYTIQLGKSIADITENNQLPDHSIVFSTGNILDSLEISGKVKDINTNIYKENIKVMLHNDGNDSSIYKIKPLYYSKTQSKGEFTFKNLHTNKYKVYALDDQNGNYLYDIGEKIGFLNESVFLKYNFVTDEINLFEEKKEKVKITDFGIDHTNKYYFVFNSPLDSCKIWQLKNETIKLISKHFMLSETSDTAFLWTLQQADSLKFIVEMIGENKTMDTLLINIGNKEKEKIEKAPQKLVIKSKINLSTKGTACLEFNEPVIKSDISKMLFYVDTMKIAKCPQIVFTDSSYTKATIKYNFEQGKIYRLILNQQTFLGIDSIFNDSMAIIIKTLRETDLGIISINIMLNKGGIPVIVQLLNEKYQPIREQIITGSNIISYNNMLPGKYYIRCIIDKNRNNKWDTGNLLKKRQPEEIVFFKDEINLKANWELNDLQLKIQ